MIREYGHSDLEQVVALLTDVYPERMTNVAGFGHRLRTEPERARRRRWVAEADGRIVGWGTSGLAAESDRDDVGYLAVSVHPDARGRGVGGELYALAEEHVLGLGARKLLSDSRDDMGSRAFAERRGYRHTHTQSISAVDPREVDLEALPELRGASARAGLQLAAFTELTDVHAVYDADLEATADIPLDEPATNISFEEWVAAHWEHPLRSLETSFAVLDGDRVAALTMLRVDTATGYAMTDMTGTRRAYRGRGLARLCKLASLDAAARLGVTCVMTENDRTNAPMLAVNDRLGFRPFSATLSWVRE